MRWAALPLTWGFNPLRQTGAVNPLRLIKLLHALASYVTDSMLGSLILFKSRKRFAEIVFLFY